MAPSLRIHAYLLLCLVTQSAGQVPLRYYGVDDVEPAQYSFLRDSLHANFALVELACDTLTWKNAITTAEQNRLNIIIWPLGHGHQYTPWVWTGSTWDISEGMDVLEYAERYIASGGEALMAILMSHEPFYNHGNPFTAAQMKMLYATLKNVAPHVSLFVYMNDMAYYDQLLPPLYPFRIENGMMDIAGIFKHHFGTKHTFADVLKEIDDDYAIIRQRGLPMQLFFALQSFATDGIEYRMPSAAEMLEYGRTIIETGKMDGVFWYPWNRVSTSYSMWLSKDRYDSSGADRWGVVRQLSAYLPTDVGRDRDRGPATSSLSQNYPNPFNPTTSIEMSIAAAGEYALELFDILGRKVADLFHGEVASGIHRVTFHSSGLPSGTYFYILNGSNLRTSKKMVIIR